MFDFLMPTHVYGGEGAAARAADAVGALGRKCLLVTGRRGARASGALGAFVEMLKRIGVEYALYDEVEPNPDVTGCYRAAARAKVFGAEFVVGIGGGSPLDAAKVTAVLATNDLTVRQLYALDWPNAPLPVVCVGTTAGTGSEVTRVSVLTCDGRKRSITADAIYPRVAVCDPVYTASCARDTTMSCGLDALCHALEGYFSKRATPLTDAVAVGAVHKLTGALAEAASCEWPLPMRLRAELYDGALMAGFVLNGCGACFPHAMSYALTEEFGVPHGFACAAFLPEFLQLAVKDCPDKLPPLGVKLGKLAEFIRAETKLQPISFRRTRLGELREQYEGNKNFLNSPGAVGGDFAVKLLTSRFPVEEA